VTDGTEVDTDELRAFADGMDARGDKIVDHSEDASSFRPEPEAFGRINRPFMDSLIDSLAQTAEGLMLLGKTVSTDATAIRDAANNYDDIEQNQVRRFGGDSRG
jgi:hypothetical protein